MENNLEPQREIAPNPVKSIDVYVPSSGIAEAYLTDFDLTWDELRGKKILDVGAGQAEFAIAAKEKGITVVSTDLYSGGMGKTDLIPEELEYIVDDFTMGLYLPDESFDIILARGSIHAICSNYWDIENVLREAKRLLKRGGEFRFGPFEGKEFLSQHDKDILVDFYIQTEKTEPNIDRKLTDEEIKLFIFLEEKYFKIYEQEEEIKSLNENERLTKGTLENNLYVTCGAIV